MPAEHSIERDSARLDTRVQALVGSGHFCSHFFGIALPPLFPLMKADLGVDNLALGFLLSVSGISTALFQTPVGFLVDRFGAWRLLVLGLGIMSGAIVALALVPGYGALIVPMIFVGLGNSVFHPADYAILSARIGASRIGRAFSLHTFAGNLGWAVAPMTLLFLATLWGWRGALFTVGLCGLALALALGFQARALHFDPDDAPASARLRGASSCWISSFWTATIRSRPRAAWPRPASSVRGPARRSWIRSSSKRITLNHNS